jgi:hypothetical protein
MTKMLAIAYMPFLLAGLILIYEKRYWLGLAIANTGNVFRNKTRTIPQVKLLFFSLLRPQ